MHLISYPRAITQEEYQKIKTEIYTTVYQTTEEAVRKSAPVQILYAFENQKTLLLEVKRTDLDSDAPKHTIYHWLLVPKDSSGSKIERLTFKKMATTLTMEIREFEQALLKFNKEKAELQKISGEKLQFTAINMSTNPHLPEGLVRALNKFFLK
ncbi:MAG: hypothetical protein HQK50_16720, partial [Oligoflexia bacterium]|nr:hypothetical protein [Oligoflexia bacterium]